MKAQQVAVLQKPPQLTDSNSLFFFFHSFHFVNCSFNDRVPHQSAELKLNWVLQWVTVLGLVYIDAIGQ